MSVPSIFRVAAPWPDATAEKLNVWDDVTHFFASIGNKNEEIANFQRLKLYLVDLFAKQSYVPLLITVLLGVFAVLSGLALSRKMRAISLPVLAILAVRTILLQVGPDIKEMHVMYIMIGTLIMAVLIFVAGFCYPRLAAPFLTFFAGLYFMAYPVILLHDSLDSVSDNTFNIVRGSVILVLVLFSVLTSRTSTFFSALMAASASSTLTFFALCVEINNDRERLIAAVLRTALFNYTYIKPTDIVLQIIYSQAGVFAVACAFQLGWHILRRRGRKRKFDLL